LLIFVLHTALVCGCMWWAAYCEKGDETVWCMFMALRCTIEIPGFVALYLGDFFCPNLSYIGSFTRDCIDVLLWSGLFYASLPFLFAAGKDRNVAKH